MHRRCILMARVVFLFRGALSARTILTRSHVCAGVSVRLCFFVHPSRVRGFHAPEKGAYVHMHVCALSGTHMCERVHVHVSAPCGCVISFSKRTLRFAPRLVKPPKGWVPLRSQNSIIFLRARARPRNENDMHATKIAANGCRRSKF